MTLTIDRALPSHETHLCRTETAEARVRAVRRVIAVMRERYDEALSLRQLSDIAISSPFHFNRVFREITGLPPGRFLAALRLQVAKQQLLTTRRSVTSICFGVGYSSLGTFTTHFAQYVGAPPSRFRRLIGVARPAGLLPTTPTKSRAVQGEVGTIRGYVRSSEGETTGGFAIVGLFPTRWPRGHPLTCTVATVGSEFCLDHVPPGTYHIFSMEINPGIGDLALFLGESMRLGHAGPIQVLADAPGPPVDLELRWPRDTDPPLLIALPILMAERLAGERAAITPPSVRRGRRL